KRYIVFVPAALVEKAMRSLGVYYVLREYHKWETDADANELCGNVIGILIQTEEEIGCDNIMEWSLEKEQNFFVKLQSTAKEIKTGI
ncbi:Protein HGH1, partial [Trichinella spiralis]